MKNTTELRNELTKVFKDVKAKKMNLNTANSLIRTSQTMLNSAKIQLQQNKFLGIEEKINFLD